MLRMLKAFDDVCIQNNLEYWLDGGTLLGAVRHGGFIPWDDDIDVMMPRKDYQTFIQIAQQCLPDCMFIQTSETDSFHHRLSTPCRIRDRNSLIFEAHQSSTGEAYAGLFIDLIPADRYHKLGILSYRDRLLKNVYFLYCDYILGRPKSGVGVIRRIKNLLFVLRPLVQYIFPIRSYARFLHRTSLGNAELKDNYLIGYSLDSKWRRYFSPHDIFPLRRIGFEGHQFLSPNNPDGVLRVFYGENYMQVPPESDRAPPHFKVVSLDLTSG